MQKQLTKSPRNMGVTLNMSIFLLSKFISSIGSKMLNFAIGLYVLNLTGSGMSFALTMIVSTVPAIILSPIVGTLADRLNKKAMVITSDLLSVVVLIIVYMINRVSGLSLFTILALVFLISVLTTFFNIAMDASLPNMVDEEHLTQINSHSSSIGSLTSIIGPSLGGFIYGFLSLENFILLAAFSFLVSAILKIFLDFNFRRIEIVEREKESLQKELKSGVDYVKTKRPVYYILLFSVFVNLVFSCFLVALPHIINVQLNFSSKDYGMIQSGFAIGGLLFSLIYSIRAKEESGFKYIIGSLVLVSLGMILSGLPVLDLFKNVSSSLILMFYIAINFFIGGASTLMNIPCFILMQKQTDEAYRGRVNGLFGMASLSIQPIGMAIGGISIDYISGALIVFVSGILYGVVTYFLYKNKELKEAF